jgi:hypothetical protein
MPLRTPRPQADKEADRASFVSLAAEIAAVREELRTGLRALPAAASRTAAQRRDALVLRTLILLVRAFLLSVGKGSAADRDGIQDV